MYRRKVYMSVYCSRIMVNCWECGKEIIFKDDVLGKSGKKRPLNPDGSFHQHIKSPPSGGLVEKPQVSGGTYDGKSPEETIREQEERQQKILELTQQHWSVVEHILNKIVSKLDELSFWLKTSNKSPSKTKEQVDELFEEKTALEDVIRLKDTENKDLQNALAKTSFKTGNEV
jgi:hypothetical protein